jgi:predicted aldo/keto reductase-like oxidoreductase
MEAALQARHEGLVHYIGVTGHNWDEVALAVGTGQFDTVLCWYNCAMKEPETTVFPEAIKHDTGVIIMNASRNDKLFGGENAPAEEDFYRYVLSHEAVSTTIMGLRDVDRFCRIADDLAKRSALSAEERQAMEEYGARMRAAGLLEIA